MSNQQHQQPNAGFGGYGSNFPPQNNQSAGKIPPYNRLAAAQAFNGSGLPYNAGFYRQNIMQMAQQPGFFNQRFMNMQQHYNPASTNPVAQQQRQQQQAIPPPLQAAILAKTSEKKAQANINSHRVSKPSSRPTSDKTNITKTARKTAASKSLVPSSNGKEKPPTTQLNLSKPAGKYLEPSKREEKPAATQLSPSADKVKIPTTPSTKSMESSSHEESPDWAGLSPDIDNLPTVARKRPAAKSLIRRRHHTTHDSIKRETAQQKPMKPTNIQKTVPRKVGRPSKPAIKAKKEDTPRKGPKEIFYGPPDEDIEGGWPDGWTKKIFKRMGGSTRGGTDKYWYSPKTNFKLRSLLEVRRFLKAMEKTNGDEEESKMIYKSMQV